LNTILSGTRVERGKMMAAMTPLFVRQPIAAAVAAATLLSYMQ